MQSAASGFAFTIDEDAAHEQSAKGVIERTQPMPMRRTTSGVPVPGGTASSGFAGGNGSARAGRGNGVCCGERSTMSHVESAPSAASPSTGESHGGVRLIAKPTRIIMPMVARPRAKLNARFRSIGSISFHSNEKFNQSAESNCDGDGSLHPRSV